MTDRSFEIVTEPSLTSNISKPELVEYISQTITPIIELENYACHAQAVERCARLVSDEAEAVCEQTQKMDYSYTNDFPSNKTSIFPLTNEQFYVHWTS